MVMDSILFVYLLLPAAVLLFALTPIRLRPVYLLAISSGFYYTIERHNLFLLLAVLLFDYLMVWLLQRSVRYPRLRRVILACSVAKSVGLFVFYSVGQFSGQIHFPLGLGVFSLISMGYVLDYYHEMAPLEKNPFSFLAGCSFFPLLYAGPLVQYGRISLQMRTLRFSWVRVGEGGGIFLSGLAKKLLLADQLYRVLETLRAMPNAQTTPLSVWVMVLTLLLTLYFYLSGYCDMARGLGKMFGMDLPENFFYPCRAKSVNEFLARFNATVSRYMRRTVYFISPNTQGGAISSCFHILCATVLMGLWFGIRLHFIAWGVCMALFVMAEKYLFPKGWSSVAPFFRWVYCAFAVLVSFVFFLGGSIDQSFYYLGSMIGLYGAGGPNNSLLYLLASNHMTLLLALILITGLPRDIARLIRQKLPVLYEMGCVLSSGLLLLGVTAYLL